MNLIDRKTAQAEGVKYYFTGKPCSKGHVAVRRTHNGECHDCHLAAKRKHYADNRETELARARDYREQNPEKHLAAVKKHYWANRDAILAKVNARWRSDIAASRERSRQQYQSRRSYYQRYYEANKEVYADRSRRVPTAIKAAHLAARRARLRQAMPVWADSKKIGEVYRAASRIKEKTGVPHDVDHIVPLKGKTVCGLHVEWNLRPIPMAENRRKHNRLDVALAISQPKFGALDTP